jgi:hypothetical protein
MRANEKPAAGRAQHSRGDLSQRAIILFLVLAGVIAGYLI